MKGGGGVETQELEGSCTLKADHPHASQVMAALRFTSDDLMAWSCSPPHPCECKPVRDFWTTVTLSAEFTFYFTSAQVSSFYASSKYRPSTSQKEVTCYSSFLYIGLNHLVRETFPFTVKTSLQYLHNSVSQQTLTYPWRKKLVDFLML